MNWFKRPPRAFRATPEAQRDPPKVADPAAAARAAKTTRAKRPFSLATATGTPWLLLAWDITGMTARLVPRLADADQPLAVARSSEATFGAALAEVLERLRADGRKLPKKAAVAARAMRPAVVDLPVNPEKPRPAAQMRELLRADLEPVLAEFAGLWTMGALLHARRHLSAADRDRVVVEEALRREDRRAPLRYGETALELALIDRATLNECLELQESLQLLDSEIMSAWTGWVAHGARHWLGGALNGTFHQQWKDSLARHGLQLDTVLPLAWLCSEAAPDGADAERDRAAPQAITLELHSEEVVAVRRAQGRIVGARNDGRMERPLQADWLLRLVEDWLNEARASLSLVCLSRDDEEAAQRVAGDLELTTGHAVRVIGAADCERALWDALARETTVTAAEQRLPRLALRELRGKPWKNPDCLRVAACAAVVLALAGVEAVQRYRVHALQSTMAERARAEDDSKKRTQMVLKISGEMQAVAKDLEKARAELQPLVNTQTRLEAIAHMRQYLPELIGMLAESVGEDAVLDRISSSRYSQDATSIQVEAWSTTYTGAQAFVNRVAARTRQLDYGVSQTEINESVGRNTKPGYRVGFWLIQEADDLEADGAPTPGGVSSPGSRP
ncbi:MAG: hypothetical protein QM739_07745 [Propionivibrio sp.]